MTDIDIDKLFSSCWNCFTLQDTLVLQLLITSSVPVKKMVLVGTEFGVLDCYRRNWNFMPSQLNTKNCLHGKHIKFCFQVILSVSYCFTIWCKVFRSLSLLGYYLIPCGSQDTWTMADFWAFKSGRLGVAYPFGYILLPFLFFWFLFSHNQNRHCIQLCNLCD